MISKKIDNKKEMSKILEMLEFNYHQYNYTLNEIFEKTGECYSLLTDKHKYDVCFLDISHNLEPISIYYYTKNHEDIYMFDYRLYGYNKVVGFLNNKFKNQFRKIIINKLLNI